METTTSIAIVNLDHKIDLSQDLHKAKKIKDDNKTHDEVRAEKTPKKDKIKPVNDINRLKDDIVFIKNKPSKNNASFNVVKDGFKPFRPVNKEEKSSVKFDLSEKNAKIDKKQDKTHSDTKSK